MPHTGARRRILVQIARQRVLPVEWSELPVALSVVVLAALSAAGVVIASRVVDDPIIARLAGPLVVPLDLR